MKEKMLVSLDGGVESLVTAWLLKKQGFQLRGILFDVSHGATDKDSLQLRVSEYEKKLGIPVQVMDCSDEAREIVFKEVELCINRGFKYEIKSIFHQKFLIPKLFELKDQFQFQKISTGHRVSLHHEPLENKMKVLRFHNPKEDDAQLLMGLTQEQLSSLLFPLGSIPIAMVLKLAAELDLKSDLEPMRFVLHNKTNHKNEPTNSVDVSNVGMSQDIGSLSVGEKFDQSIVFDFNSNINQIAGNHLVREIKEIWLENASWFSGDDLGFKIKSCLISWEAGLVSVPVQMIQFEGGGMKALLDQPLTGENANIFIGDIILCLENDSVLGGARVIKCL